MAPPLTSILTSDPTGSGQRHPHHPAKPQRHQRSGALPQEGGGASVCHPHPEGAGRTQRPVGDCLQTGEERQVHRHRQENTPMIPLLRPGLRQEVGSERGAGQDHGPEEGDAGDAGVDQPG